MVLPTRADREERRQLLRQLRRAAGLAADDQRETALADAFDGLLALAARLRSARLGPDEPATFRSLEVR